MTGLERGTGSFFAEMRAQIEATPRPTARRMRLPRWPRAAVRRVHLILLGGASLTGAAVTLAVVLLLDSTTGAPPAYAGHQHGSVKVTFEELTHPREIKALNAMFQRLAIAEVVIPIKANCHSPDGSGPIVMYPDPAFEGERSTSLTLSTHGGRPAPPGWHYVLAAKALPDGKVLAFIGSLKKPIPTCLPYRAHRP